MNRLKTESATDTLKLLKFATTLDPHSIADIDHRSRHGYIEAAWQRAGIRPRPDYGTTEKLWQGLSDTNAIVHNALNDNTTDEITVDQALSIVQHDISVDTIAYAAQLGERSLRSTNHDQFEHNLFRNNELQSWQLNDSIKDPRNARRFIIDTTIGAIIQNPEFDDSWETRSGTRGCPFAYSNPERPKIFDNFTRWAGIIAVRTYYDQQK
jgi:hypothetical protein